MQFNSWMNKDDWSKQICEVHNIQPKMLVINTLHTAFMESEKDLDGREFPDYTTRQTYRTNIACQILALTFELTEDLASTCFSYAKAIKQGTKNVPEYLRDFADTTKKDVGNPKDFYAKASRDIIFASEMVGVDPINDVGTAITFVAFFKKVKEFRDRYDDWYQGYKHGQRTLAMYIWPSDQIATKGNTQFILYRIPQEIREVNTRIFVEADFVPALKEETNYFQIADEVTGKWFEVKQRQFPRVFPNPP
jgi:hypothetical protein